jgi:lycopene cyclase domain-containing protein
MTYLEFLGIFLIVPIGVVGTLAGRSLARRLWWQLLLVAAVAVIYTGPWDGALISEGVWSYAPGQVLGRTVLRVPLEEYGFYVLQVVLAGMVTALVWRRLERR